MDAAAGEGGGGFVNYAQIEEYFNNMALEGPSAQDRMDLIVSQIISLLPMPFVPAPDADDSSDSDDDHFSLTSSDSEDDAAAADRPAVQDGDGQDHISHLPDDLLSNIISRLPTKEAARTMVLSTRWLGVWAATPLLVDDAHLKTDDAHRDFNAVRAVSRCVAAHPGPVRAVRFTRTSFYHQEYALEQLIASLAAKKIQDLILFNRPWPLDMPLPGNILNCASLTRLYIGVWRWSFPDTTTLRPAFPNLHELGLFHSIVEDSEVDAMLAHCPKLKILSFAIAYIGRSRLRIKSSSLCVVMEWGCSFDEIIVEDAPCLERLLFQSIFDRRPVKIVHAPRLEVLGYLDLQLHALEIGGIVIRAGMNVRASAMLPSLKILAVKVRLSHDMEVKMLHTLLRCFPRLETLHIMSIQSTSPDGVHHAEFWKSQGSCDYLESHLKTFVLHGFQGLNCELLFLGYILKNGKVLKTLGMVCRDSDDVVSEAGRMSCSVGEGNAPPGGSSVSDDAVVEGGPMSGSSVEGNVSSGGSSGSEDVVIEGGPVSGSVGEGNVSSGGSSGSEDVVMEGGPVSGSVGEGNVSSGGSSGSEDVVMEGGPVSGSVGEANVSSGGSSGSEDVVMEGGPVSGSVGEGNVSSGGSSGSEDVVMEGGPVSGSVGEGNVSSGGSSGSEDVVMEGGPVSGSVDEGNAPSGGSSVRNIIHVCPASPSWSFQNAIDLSVEDPFCVLRPDRAWRAYRVGA